MKMEVLDIKFVMKMIKLKKIKIGSLKMEECDICVQKYTQKLRKKITCSKCNFSCCSKCLTKYVIEFKSIQCIKCKQELPINITYNNKLHLYQYEIIFNKEIKRTIEYQNIIMVMDNMKKCSKEYISIHRLIRIESVLLNDPSKLLVLNARLQELNYNEKRAVVDNFIDNGLYDQTIVDEVMNKKGDNILTFNKKIKCPVDNCKGFLNDNYYCSLCNSDICKQCKNKLDEKHECKHEDIAIVKLVEKECKMCPKCGINIQKIKGCDQMFCVSCKTKFNYYTGQIYNDLELFHNPHYSEFINNQNENIIHLNFGNSSPLLIYIGKIYNCMRKIVRQYDDNLYKRNIRQIMIQYFKNVINKKSTIRRIKEITKEHNVNKQLKNVVISFIDEVYPIFIKIAIKTNDYYIITDKHIRSKDVYDNLLTIYNNTFIKIKDICKQNMRTLMWPYVLNIPDGFPKEDETLPNNNI
jgi:hypothetical protein